MPTKLKLTMQDIKQYEEKLKAERTAHILRNADRQIIHKRIEDPSPYLENGIRAYEEASVS